MRYGIKYVVGKLFQRLLSPSAINNCELGKNARIGRGCQVVNTKIGRYSYINSNCAVVNAEIGSFCSIASGTMIGGGGHPLEWVSTSPVFQKGRNAFGKNFSKLEYEPYSVTKIGHDVWIGAHSMIKGGVVIGDGAVVGMGSVVTHDVPPYTVAAGNPAREIKKRFDDDTAARLLELRWWDLDENRLYEIAPCFNDPAAFIERMSEFNRGK